jgi:hypothetical protein
VTHPRRFVALGSGSHKHLLFHEPEILLRAITVPELSGIVCATEMHVCDVMSPTPLRNDSQPKASAVAHRLYAEHSVLAFLFCALLFPPLFQIACVCICDLPRACDNLQTASTPPLFGLCVSMYASLYLQSLCA